jgi:hypothetical protein
MHQVQLQRGSLAESMSRFVSPNAVTGLWTLL